MTKIVRKSRNASASPHAERKISTGSNASSRGGARRAPQERQPIMVASIANFDQPRKFSSVKPPNFRKAMSTQTSNPGSDYDSDYTPAGEISISIKTDPPVHQLQAIRKCSTGKVVVDVTDQGLVTRDGLVQNDTDERIAESPQLFIPPSPPPPPPSATPPPPTPLIERKKMDAKADELIHQHHDLIAEFPPIPNCAKADFPEIKVEVGRKVPPPIPRKDKINHANVHKMKIITAKSAAEVHRRKSPQHENQDQSIRATPIFSDAAGSVISQSIFSDAHDSATEDAESEIIKNPQNLPAQIGESKIPDVCSDMSAPDDTEIESVKGIAFTYSFKLKLRV